VSSKNCANSEALLLHFWISLAILPISTSQMLLLMEEIPNNHLGIPGIYKTLQKVGINYQPQLVSRISKPSTVSSVFYLDISVCRSNSPQASLPILGLGFKGFCASIFSDCDKGKEGETL